MSLSLSSQDLERLTAVMGTLVSPLEQPSLEDWGRASMLASAELLGADQWFFGGPVAGRPFLTVVQDANGAAAVRDYFAYYHEVDMVLGQRRRQRHLEVHHRDLLYEPGELARDELHNDWCIPYRLHDTLGLGVSVPEHPTLPFLAHFYHERYDGPRFGQRGLDLLHLLLPAFKAGVQTVRQFEERRQNLLRLLDRLEEALLVYDTDGRLLHQNPAAQRLLAAEHGVDRARLEHEARRIAVGTVGILRRYHPGVTAAPYRELRTMVARYRLAGSLLGEAVLGRPAAAVAIARVPPEPLSDEGLRNRFRLTPREIQVARLLAAGRSDAEVAATLGVTRHTAARHAEHVRRKLGVHRRAGVGAKLQGW